MVEVESTIKHTIIRLDINDIQNLIGREDIILNEYDIIITTSQKRNKSVLDINDTLPKPKFKIKQESLRGKISDIIKGADRIGGIYKIDMMNTLCLKLKKPTKMIDVEKEITKLLEQGVIYEIRTNKLRWLG